MKITVEEALEWAKTHEDILKKMAVQLRKACSWDKREKICHGMVKDFRPLSKYKGKLLGIGISRIVLGIGPYAIKYQFGNKQNQHEIKYWKTISSSQYKKYFMPILLHEGKYLVMPRGKAYQDNKIAQSAVSRLYKALHKSAADEQHGPVWQVLAGAGFDLHFGNIVKFENRVRICDYGI